MKFYVIWKTALKAIMKNRRRSFLTMLGIIIGIASIITIMAIGRGFQKETIDNLTMSESGKVSFEVFFVPHNMNLYNTSMSFFPDDDVRKLREVEGVDQIYVQEADEDLFSVELEGKEGNLTKRVRFVNETQEPLVFGRNLTHEDEVKHNKVAIINSETATQLHGSEERALGYGVDLNGQMFHIVGVFETRALTAIEQLTVLESDILILSSAYEKYFSSDERVVGLTMTVKEGFTPTAIMREVTSLLTDEGSMNHLGQYSAMDMGFLIDSTALVIDGLTYFISAVAGISLFIAGIGVMNMMYISVAERTREIGIRRAMGATEKAIKLQFLLEGMTITLIGGFIGYVLGLVLAYSVSLILPFSIAFDVFTIVLALVISTLIGLIFSVMPASVAAKKDLIDILK